MAKNGIITGSGAAAILIAAVLPPSVATGNLGSLAQDILRNKAGQGILLIDTGAAKLALHEFSAQAQSDALSLIDMSLAGDMEFIPTDATKSTSAYNVSVTGDSAETGQVVHSGLVQPAEVQYAIAALPVVGDVVAELVPSRPTFSGASLINTIADAAKEKGKEALVIVDQQGGRMLVRFYDDVSGAVDVATAPLDGAVPEAVFEIEYAAGDTAVSSSIFGI